MPLAMAALSRSKSGTYTARKGVPKDVQEEYAPLIVIPDETMWPPAPSSC
jgi:hypothetical protein